MEEYKTNSRRPDLKVNTRSHIDTSVELWSEVRPIGRHPSRRSYHSACVWRNQMLIYGGQDLREGPQGGLWALRIPEFNSGEDEEWVEIPIQDLGPLCRHTGIVKDNRMFIFGGSNGDREFNDTLVLDLISLQWTVWTPDVPTCPPPLDSHTACLYEEGSVGWMVVFGGFVQGDRTNEVYILNLTTAKWKNARVTGNKPPSRSNHSSVVYRDHLFIFGGSNDEGEKLNDLWKLDLRTYNWEQIRGLGQVPTPRSGQTAILYKDYMIIFGGMRDITKETNEMYSYEFSSNLWTMFQDEQQIKDPVSAAQLEEFKKAKSPLMPRSKTIKEESPNKSSEVNKSPELSSGDSSPTRGKRTSLYIGPAAPVVGKINGKAPHPRDGHSSILFGDMMIVFGGDRHQMPFNDVYSYALVEQTIKTPLILN